MNDEYAFVLVCTGSGMSADSGLATYDDVESKGIDYRDLSSTAMLAKSPAVFAKWADRCVEAYRAATPHEGYALLRRLQEELQLSPRNAELCRVLHDEMNKGSRTELLDATNMPGRVFFATTNVDSMFRRAGLEHVCELHGSYERWQCSGLALPEDGLAPFVKFGRVCRAETWPLNDDWQPTGALPMCRWCGKRPARPAVYHFGDAQFVSDVQAEATFVCFAEAVAKLQLPVLLIEVGVGLRLPRLRRVLADIRAANTGAVHVRVNPREEAGEAGVRHMRDTAVNALRTLLGHEDQV